MNRRSGARWLESFSDNLKSKIENPKWWGIFAIAFAFAFSGVVAEAQQHGKIFRIGYLDSSTASGRMVILDVFRPEMNKLGWIVGEDVNIEYRITVHNREG